MDKLIEDMVIQTGIKNGRYFALENKYGFFLVSEIEPSKSSNYQIFSLNSVKINKKDGGYWKGLISYVIKKDRKYTLMFDDFYKELRENNLLKANDVSLKGSFGVNIKDGKSINIDLIDALHIAVLGKTGSGKSVIIKNLIYQYALVPYSEFYFIYKGSDFVEFEGAKKSIYAKDFMKMGAAEFVNLFTYLSIEQSRRSGLFEKAGATDLLDYNRKRKDNPSSGLPPLTYITMIIDEYETIRSTFGAELGKSDGVSKFDDIIGNFINVCRYLGIRIVIGSQNFTRGQLGVIRSNIGTKLYGKIDGSPAVDKEYLKTIINGAITGTNMFFYDVEEAFLKVPFDPRMGEKINDVLNDVPDDYYPKKADNISDLILTAIKQGVDSDILTGYKRVFGKMLGFDDDYIKKIEKSDLFLAIVVLNYVIFRALSQGILNKNYEIFSSINFPKKLDTILFLNINNLNAPQYKKMIDALKNSFDGAGHKGDFIKDYRVIIKNFLDTIIGDTSLNIDNLELEIGGEERGVENVSHDLPFSDKIEEKEEEKKEVISNKLGKGETLV